MTDKEKKLLGKGLLEDCSVKDVIDYFGADKILDKVDDDDIVERVNCWILRQIDDDELVDAVSDSGLILDSFSISDIEDNLYGRGYSVMDTKILETENILDKLEQICRELKQKGYIDKEDAKRLICDYLDFWMDRSF